MVSARERIYEATLDLVTSEGYDAIDVDRIVSRAGVEREEFDALFSSKEDCALGVFDDFLGDYERTVRKAYDSQREWADSIRAAAYALCGWMVEHPREVRFGTIQMLWASDLAQARREAGFKGFVDLVDAGRRASDDPDSIPAFTAEGVIGSIAEVLTKSLQRDDFEPYRFVPEMMFITVRPYLGEEAAARELTMVPPPRPGAPS